MDILSDSPDLRRGLRKLVNMGQRLGYMHSFSNFVSTKANELLQTLNNNELLTITEAVKIVQLVVHDKVLYGNNIRSIAVLA
jgi:hypothetical protein